MSDDILQIAEKLEASSSEAAKIKEHVIAEIKRLQAHVENCEDDFVCQMKSMESELATWQQIAIDERAEVLRIRRHNSPAGTDWRDMAGKELGLQVSQEAGYLERLEKEFLKLKYDIYFRPYNWDSPDEEHQKRGERHAQAALEKIRKG